MGERKLNILKYISLIFNFFNVFFVIPSGLLVFVGLTGTFGHHNVTLKRQVSLKVGPQLPKVCFSFTSMLEIAYLLYWSILSQVGPIYVENCPKYIFQVFPFSYLATWNSYCPQRSTGFWKPPRGRQKIFLWTTESRSTPSSNLWPTYWMAMQCCRAKT